MNNDKCEFFIGGSCSCQNFEDDYKCQIQELKTENEMLKKCLIKMTYEKYGITLD